MIESENQIENAATEDVQTQTDVEDDLAVMESENQVENANDDLQDTAAEGQVAKLKSFWENL